MDFWQIIMTPFSWLLKTFCQVFNSYAIALFLFGLVVKIILAPFQYKGKKSMIKMTVLNGQMQEIQKRCGNDKERYSRELQEFYTKNNVNPMGGCGWSLLPLLVMWPLYAIIRRPLKYLMRLTEEASVAVAGALNWTSSAFAHGATEFVPGMGYNELTLASMMNAGNLETAKAAAVSAGASAAGMFVINFNFLGMDLSQIPSLTFWKSDAWAAGNYWGAIGLFLLPVISAALSLVSSIVSTRTNAMNKEQAEAAAKSNRMMFIMMPLMSAWIGFTLPAGLCIYWITNSLLMMVQEVIFNKMLKKDYEAAQQAMAEQQRKQKEEEKERRRAAAEKKAAALAAGKGKKNAQPPRKKGTDVSASREGLRTYARGRAYDPNRYPITPYHDPDGPKKEELPPPDGEEPVSGIPEEAERSAPGIGQESAGSERPGGEAEASGGNGQE